MIKSVCNLKKDDKVKVMTGKDTGKVSKVLKVNRKKNRILVESVNIMKKHSKPNMKNKQGGIVETEALIHWSNVLLMCNKCLAPVRIQYKILEDGKKMRVCRKCNELIDK